MKQIKGVFNLSNTDYDEFNEKIIDTISKLQKDNQEVEVQYKVNNFDNGQLVYSALILGRVEV